MVRQYQPTPETQTTQKTQKTQPKQTPVVPVVNQPRLVNPQVDARVMEDYPYLPSDEFLPQPVNPSYGWEYDVPVLREDIVVPVKQKSTKKLGGKVYKK
jgi:hypothetical protein